MTAQAAMKPTKPAAMPLFVILLDINHPPTATTMMYCRRMRMGALTFADQSIAIEIGSSVEGGVTPARTDTSPAEPAGTNPVTAVPPGATPRTVGTILPSATPACRRRRDRSQLFKPPFSLTARIVGQSLLPHAFSRRPACSAFWVRAGQSGNILGEVMPLDIGARLAGRKGKLPRWQAETQIRAGNAPLGSEGGSLDAGVSSAIRSPSAFPGAPGVIVREHAHERHGRTCFVDLDGIHPCPWRSGAVAQREAGYLVAVPLLDQVSRFPQGAG